MTDNLRWLIALSAASITLYLLLTARRKEVEPAIRTRTAVAVGGLLVFWAAAELPPFQPWTSAGWSGLVSAIDTARSPETLVACLTYLAIVVASSRGLIGMPIYRQLQARADELRGTAESGCVPADDSARLTTKIDRAEHVGARRIGGFVLSVPLPDVLGANQTLNGIEKQMLSDLSDGDLRLAASQIAALMPATDQGSAAARTIAAVVSTIEKGQLRGSQADSELRNASASALILLHRQRDLPQEREVNHIRVSIWLTVVGLAATYALGVTWPGHDQIMIAGALGGLLGSLSALITNRQLSLGMVVLSPVAGALNALGGTIVIGFLAQEQIQVLGAVFRGVWTEDGQVSVTALAAAVLLGFSGGLFSRIAVAGTAPLLASSGKADGSPSGATLVPTRSSADEPRPQADASTNGHAPGRQVPVPVPVDEERAKET